MYLFVKAKKIHTMGQNLENPCKDYFLNLGTLHTENNLLSRPK
jgi:hypothetical protein